MLERVYVKTYPRKNVIYLFIYLFIQAHGFVLYGHYFHALLAVDTDVIKVHEVMHK